MKITILIILVISSFVVGVSQADDSSAEWVYGAVWYKILPERFRNINPANDPVKKNVVEDADYDWQVHPWASDWYKLQVWEKERNLSFPEVVSDRRYGGDLIGVIEKLPYLHALGVNAIYLTPVFESPSIEKYDASSFHHIDDNFGIDRAEDRKKIIAENEDPANWTMAKSDEIFFELLQQAHLLKMKVILEASFSYCGEDFFAFKDLKNKQKKSKYKDWFDVVAWDDPMTPDTVEFSYKFWQGDRQRPLFKTTPEGALTPPVAKYVFDVTTRWMDPDSDKVTTDGIDGWSIKDSDALSDKFWREWNAHVRKLNRKAITISDKTDKTDFTVEASKKLSKNILRFWAKPEKENLEEFTASLKKIRDERSESKNRSAFIQLSDIQSVRFPSAIVNADKLKIANGVDVFESSGFSPLKPDSTQHKIQKLMVVFQLTYLGAPFILYGDESGMWGAGYPDNLKPMLWNEFIYERESYKTEMTDLGEIANTTENQLDRSILDIYIKLNDLRKETDVLVKGEYELNFLDAETGALVYSRKHKGSDLYVFMNLGDEKQEIVYQPGWKKNQKVKDVLSFKTFKIDKFKLKLELEPKSFRVLLKE